MLAALPGLFWTAGPETATRLRQAGVGQFAAPPEQAGAWKQAGFNVTPLSVQALEKRTKLTPPGIDRKVTVASATTAPWVNANGWQFHRNPRGEFWSEVPAGFAPLAAAEAFAYGANVLMKIDPGDLDAFGKMQEFLRSIPERSLEDVADFGFIDNGSEDAGELLNLLSRRNLLYRVVRAPDPKLRINVKPTSDDPHLFAAKVREQIHDDQRSLRVYGSEVVLCRLTADASHTRVHVLNYGVVNYGRNPVQGVRLRVRGTYTGHKLYAPETIPDASKPLTDYASADGFTEFSIPVLGAYAVIDLDR